MESWGPLLPRLLLHYCHLSSDRVHIRRTVIPTRTQLLGLDTDASVLFCGKHPHDIWILQGNNETQIGTKCTSGKQYSNLASSAEHERKQSSHKCSTTRPTRHQVTDWLRKDLVSLDPMTTTGEIVPNMNQIPATTEYQQTLSYIMRISCSGLSTTP